MHFESCVKLLRCTHENQSFNCLDMPLWTLLERTEIGQCTYGLFQLVHTFITEQDFGTTEPGLLLMSDIHDQYLTILLSGCFLCFSGVSMGEDSCSLYTVERKWLINYKMVSLRSRSFVYCCTTAVSILKEALQSETK